MTGKQGAENMNTRYRYSLLLLGVLFCVSAVMPVAQAQPILELRHFKANAPQYYYYQLYFATYCGDSVIYDIKKSQLILEERHGLIDTNDYLIDRFASPTRNSCYDLALVFDNSSSITTDELAAFTAAGRALVDTMSQACQRCALITYADRPTLRSFLTSDRAIIASELGTMSAGGNRALYDAINTGVIEMITNGEQNVRILLVLAGGNDNARIFIIGTGGVSDHQSLEKICSETGGIYMPAYPTNDLEEAYRNLAGFFQREFDEHRITRRTKGVDMRNTLIRMRLEACDDSVWVEKTFMAEATTGIPATPAAQIFSLDRSWPNPVSARAAALHIRFTVAAATSQHLQLQLFDGLGRKFATITEGEYPPGVHTVSWHPAALPAGVYYYRLAGGAQVATGTMTVLP
jgi:hypothetical protein